MASLENGEVTTFEIHPDDAGIPVAQAEGLRGGLPEENAKALAALLDGEKGPYRDIVLLNTAAALVVAGKISNLRDGVALARETIDSGRAREKLDALVAITNSGN